MSFNLIDAVDSKEKEKAALNKKEELLRKTTAENLKNIVDGNVVPVDEPFDINVESPTDEIDDDRVLGNSKIGTMKAYLSKLTPREVFDNVRNLLSCEQL